MVGFLAGWGFVVGKIASCAAMALTFAAYVAPRGWERPIAVAAVIILATVNYHGVTRTARLTKIIIVIVLAALALVVAASLSGDASTSIQSWVCWPAAGMASCSRPGCCSLHSPAMPGSRPWVRRFATRNALSPGRS